MNAPAMPFLRLLLPFGAGIALANWLETDVVGDFVWLGLAGWAVLWLARRRYDFGKRWVFGPFQQAFLCLFGYFYTLEFNELRRQGHFSKHLAEGSNYAAGILDEAPSKGDTKLRIRLKVQCVGPQLDSLRACTGALLAYLDITPEHERLRYGDRVLLRAKILPIEPPRNPHAFDYRRWLHHQNIHFQCFAKSDSVRFLSSAHGNSGWRFAFDCREHLLRLLRAHFRTPDEYGVAVALLLGQKDDLSDELRTAYAETGSMHALAVSGTHVSIIFLGLIFVLRRIRLPIRAARWLEPGLALLAIWFFTLLTGASASVVRAATMFSVFLAGRAFFRQSNVWNTLPAAAFIQLIFNPLWLFDAGFQLSYAAVAGMAFFYPRLLQFVPFGFGRLQKEVLSTLLVGVAAQIGTLPLSLFYFHQFPGYFWLSGWVVMLGGALFLYGCFFLAVFSWCCPPLADWLGTGLYLLTLCLNKAIFFIQKLPFALLEGIWLAAWAAALLYAALALFSMAFVKRKASWLVAGFSVLAVLSVARSAHVFSKLEQRKVLIYNVSKRSLLDFFDGPMLITIRDSMPEKQARFAAQTNRIASRARADMSLLLGRDSLFSGKNLCWQGPVVQFFDKKIALVERGTNLPHAPPAPLKVDAVLLRGSPRVRLADLARIFDCRCFVADGSNAWSKVQAWQKEAASLGIDLHDTRERGAWILEF